MVDTITSTDVGLKENEEDDRGHGLFGFNVFSRANRWAQPITYIDVHECDGFTVCYIISFTLFGSDICYGLTFSEDGPSWFCS